jgi:hypothetical protein
MLSFMRLTLILLALTTTAQAQWTIQQSHTTASLRGIHALGNGIAWASGTAGTVLRTTDDGTTWQTCTTPPEAEKLDFRGIQAFDANTAIVMSSGKGDLSRLYRTTDACKSWKLLLTNPDKEGFWDAIQFRDSQHGFLLGDPVLVPGSVERRFSLRQTFDGGISWTTWELTTPELRAKEGASIFAASNSALIAEGGLEALIVTGGSPTPLFIRANATRPGMICDCSPMPPEKEWNNTLVVASQPAPFKAGSTSGIFSLACTDSSVQACERFGLMAVGGDYAQPDATYATSAHYFHGNWTRPETPPHGYRSSVAYSPTTKTWITVGPNGTDISTDDGKNWQPLKPTPQEEKDADQNWNALSLPFVVGPKGRIGKLNPTTPKP